MRLSAQEYRSARTFSFIGFIFYALTIAFGLLGALIVFVVFSTVWSPGGVVPFPGTTYFSFPFFIVSIVFLVMLIPAFILTIFAWLTVKHIDEGRIGQARINSLILGIVGLFFGMVLGGIFFLVAYAKLGETAPQPYQPPSSSQRFCVNCGRPISADVRFCPHCGKEQPP